jgi:uncharacterized membrane protein (UPF0127 family)
MNPKPRSWSSEMIGAILIIALIITAGALYFLVMDYGTSNIPLSSFPVGSIDIVKGSNSTVNTGLVYVASTNAEQVQGFQNVHNFGNCNGKSVNESTQCLGMIFVSASTQNLCFWMHNTPLPLQQVWISSNGTVVYIYQAQKNSDKSVCQTGLDVLETSPNASISLGDGVILKS